MEQEKIQQCGRILAYDPKGSRRKQDAVQIIFDETETAHVLYLKEHYPKIQTYINSCGMYEVEVMKELATVLTLTKINFILDRDIKQPVIYIIVTLMPQLTAIHLNNSGLEDEDVQKLSKHYPELKQLYLINNNLTIKGLESICRNNKSLQKLDFSWIQIGVEGAKLISQNLKSLQVLILKQCQIEDEGLDSIFRSLSFLCQLDVWNNRVTAQGVKNISPSIRILGLQNNQLSAIEEPIFYQPRQIVNLRLTSTQITDSQLLNFVQHLPRLKVLNLQNNNITVDGLKYILQNCKILQQLNLESNKSISNKDLQYLSKMSHLTHLCLDFCYIAPSYLILFRKTKLEYLSLLMPEEYSPGTFQLLFPPTIVQKILRNNRNLLKIINTAFYAIPSYYNKTLRNMKIIAEQRCNISKQNSNEQIHK